MLRIILVPQRNQLIAQLSKCVQKHNLGHLNNKAAGSQPLVFLQKQNWASEFWFESFLSHVIVCPVLVVSSQARMWAVHGFHLDAAHLLALAVQMQSELLTEGFPIAHPSWRDTESTSQGYLMQKLPLPEWHLCPSVFIQVLLGNSSWALK